MNTKDFGVLASSEDPGKIGDTVKGIILGGGVFIIYGLKYFGIEVATEAITELAVQAGTAFSAVWIAYGAVKKVVIFIQQLFK